MRLFVFIMMTLCFSISFAAEKLTFTGEVFDLSGKEKKFTSEKYIDNDGEKQKDRTVYKDLTGQVVVEEKMETLNNKLVRYDIDQKQTNEQGWIEVKDNKVTFNHKKPKKNNYPKTSDLPENFVVSPQIVPFIRDNWDAITSNKEIVIGLGVWHRQEIIRFTLNREKADGQNVVVKMNPSSFFIRALVDPIYFTFDPVTKNLLSYKGRTAPKEKKGDSFEDFDAITHYKTL